MTGEIQACILVNTKIGTEHRVAETIKGAANAADVNAEVVVTYGTYDIAICARAKDISQIDKFVTLIRGIPEVTATVTLIGSAVY